MAAVRYKVAVEGYPRFKHFHDRLSSISSRLENLEAVGNFASCISMGKEKFDNIMNETKQLLKQDIHLTIVTNGVGLPLQDSFVSGLRVGDVEAKMSWENIQQKGIEEDIKSLSKFAPHFVIFLATVSMSEMIEKNKHLLDKINGNPENIVVHDMTSDITCTYSYPELVDSTLKKQAEDLKEILKTVGLKIQYMLEDRAVEILENIVDFNRTFAPGDGQDMDLTISLECSQQVRENFDNEHIISDLDPEKNGVARRKIDQEAMETDGEPFEPQQKQQLTEEELETIFYEKYIEFLCMKTKCTTCDHLAQKFGISGSLVNEFLNEGYFKYEENYRKAVEPMRKLRWSQVKKCREGGMVQYDYVMRQTSFLREAEEYVQKMVKLLAEFGKMNFEIYGLLRHTVVPVGLEMPVYPAVSREMSDDLLGLGEVVGCGTIYGKLTIHLEKGQYLINHELKENIRKILMYYQFPQSFRLQELLETTSHAAVIDTGDQLKAQHGEEEKFGTLGCFIGLREREKGYGDKSSDAKETIKKEGEGDTDSKTKKGARLYGITCAHCVTGCHSDIQVRKIPDGTFEDFGNTEYVLYDGEKIDIAAIRVTKAANKCNPEISLSRWDFYTGEAEKLHTKTDVVYKHGAVSKTTVGIIVSDDYMQKVREDLPDWSGSFNTEFNIFIDHLAAEGLSQQQLFSSNDSMLPIQQASDDQAAEDVEMQVDTRQTQEYPIFTRPLSEALTVRAGADVIMECTVVGNPNPKVTWYRGEQELSCSGSVIIETAMDQRRLIIRRVSQLEAGSYRALATNIAGQAESICNLQVDMPTFSRPGDSGAVVYYHNIDDGGVRLASLLGGNVVLYDLIHGRVELSYSSHLKKSLDALCDENNLEIVMPWDVPSN